jgi:hypothetical protein
MNKTMDEKPPPKSGDLEGWRQAIKDGSFRTFRLETIVAALQDLGPRTDKAIRNPLAKHLSDAMLRMLRAWVGFHHPNQGRDLIDRVHAQAWDALLKPQCADGKGYRKAFGARLKFRLKDAIAVEARAARDFEHDPARRGQAGDTSAAVTAEGSDAPPQPAREECYEQDDDIVPSRRVTGRNQRHLHDAVKSADEERYVESILQLVKDDRRRLAFRLHMEGVPYKSSKSNSIAEALGIDEKTARQWVKEVQNFLQSKLGGNP